jgi:CHAT domain-containing protein
LADLARGSTVQGALAAAILRASINDSELASLIRRTQDLDFQILQTTEQLTELQTRKDTPKVRALVEDARARLAKLREQSDRTQAELKRRLPDYSELLSPKLLSISDAQKLLRPQEALISIYSSEKSTLVWSLAAQGQPAFAVVDLSAARMSELVNILRKGLDPSDLEASQIPSYEYTAAHELFLKLLAPVEAGWNSAKELIIVPHGALGQLPFSVLVTSDFKPKASSMLFSEHGGAPWLLKRAAISYLPSVAALGSLRRAATQKSPRSFIAFADPVFSSSPGKRPLTRGIDRRVLKRSSSPEARDTQDSAVNLSLLQGLPDTAMEVGDIAKILGADDSRDIFLGKRASEQLLKSTDLAQYRTVMFATHGLTAGELPGLYQPALALSNPTVTGEKEDGVTLVQDSFLKKLRLE